MSGASSIRNAVKRRNASSSGGSATAPTKSSSRRSGVTSSTIHSTSLKLDQTEDKAQFNKSHNATVDSIIERLDLLPLNFDEISSVEFQKGIY